MPARIFLGGFAFLLAWTVGVHLAAFQAWPFWTLYGVLACAVLLGAFGAVRSTTVFDAETLQLPEIRLLPWSPREAGPVRWAIMLLLAGAFLVTAGLQYKLSLFTPFWASCVAVGVAALAFRGRLGPVLPLQFVRDDTAKAHNGSLVFLGMTAAAVVFYLFTSVPDSDDSLFLNLAVGAKDAREAIYVRDTMLGLDGLGFFKSTYRLESYQLLSSILSDATGWPVIFVAHTVLPVALCIWAVSALTLIHAALFPRIFAVTLGIHLLLLVALDGSIQSFGYHAIPRFFHGKGPFVTVMIPLISVLSVLAVRQGSWRALLLLGGAIVISVGMTANAVYVGPLCAGLLGLTFLFLGGETRGRAFRLFLIVLYPAGLVLYLLLFDPPSGSEHALPGTVGSTIWNVFGTPAGLMLGLAGFFLAVCLPLLHPGLTACGIYALCALIVVLNPVIWPYYGQFVTGNINYRLFWTIPLPLIAVIFLGLVWSTRAWIPRILVLGNLLAGVAGSGSILRKVEFGLAFKKVPPVEFALAERVIGSTGPDAVLLAPEEISAWVTVQENAPPVVEGRIIYLPQRQDVRLSAALQERADLYSYWTGLVPQEIPAATTLELLRSVDVSAVLVDMRRPHHAQLVTPILEAGFTETWSQGPYRLLVKGP